MPNPKHRLGPITVQAGANLEKFRLVKLNEEGLAVHAGASDNPHGAVTERGQAAPTDNTGSLALQAPTDVALHIGGIVQVTTDETGIKKGAAVYAAADGKVAASGSVYIGWAEREPKNGRVPVVLQLPAQAAPSAPAA